MFADLVGLSIKSLPWVTILFNVTFQCHNLRHGQKHIRYALQMPCLVSIQYNRSVLKVLRNESSNEKMNIKDFLSGVL